MQKLQSNYHYRGRIIALIPRMEGYVWVCQYVITKSGKTEMHGSPQDCESEKQRGVRPFIFIQ